MTVCSGPDGWFMVDGKVVKVKEFADELMKCKGKKLEEARKTGILEAEFKIGGKTFSFSQG